MINKDKIKEIYLENQNRARENFSKNATRNDEAFRLKKEDMCYMRSDFTVDRDRILHSGAYRRYQGKTQVFSFTNMFDEETSTRSLHTTYVSQISRTIARMLCLNLELVEAIALGHDLGHSPFGHDGEVSLSRCCVKHGIGEFHHNIQSLHVVDNISQQGEGLNLTFQVRDGIISHDGEVHNTTLKPQRNKTEQTIQDYIKQKKKGEEINWMPATLEGCVVRISDTIAYIGQDIEDAIRLKIIKRNELPEDCVKYLGNTNSSIIDTLIKSVIFNSYDKDHISFDKESSYYLYQLKNFNYNRIYANANVKKSRKIINKSMDIIFDQYLEDIEENSYNSKIFIHFLNQKNKEYISSYTNAEKVRDFISSMTDRYYNEEIKTYLLPGSFY